MRKAGIVNAPRHTLRGREMSVGRDDVDVSGRCDSVGCFFVSFFRMARGLEGIPRSLGHSRRKTARWRDVGGIEV